MNNTQKLTLTLIISAFTLAMLLMATSCNSYGNKCLSPGSLNGAGKTKFNK